MRIFPACLRSSLRLALVLLTLPTASSAATKYKVLHTFSGAASYPSSGLVADGAGNLYGVSNGAVYELSPLGSNWQYTALALIPGGRSSIAAGNLVIDSLGNLYGSTWQGGSAGCGFIFEVSPLAGGSWTLSTIYNFDCTHGGHAGFTMAMDSAGNLYGGANLGGSFDYGVVYELSPASGGSWTYTVLHNFTNAEGNGPQVGVLFDSSGNLYGATGTRIFKLSPSIDGTWSESDAYAFTAADGSNLLGDLTFDSAGNLYGTNQAGGRYESGVAFKLTPNGSGGWTGTVLHAFNFSGSGGYNPEGALILDPAGNIYGTASGSNRGQGFGVVFKLGLVSGQWVEQVLHTFTGLTGNDGASPQNSLYLNSAGFLLGVTNAGGSAACNPTSGCGTIYEVSR